MSDLDAHLVFESLFGCFYEVLLIRGFLASLIIAQLVIFVTILDQDTLSIADLVLLRPLGDVILIHR